MYFSKYYIIKNWWNAKRICWQPNLLLLSCGCCSCLWCCVANRMRTSAAINKQLKWKYNFQVVYRQAQTRTQTHPTYAMLQYATECGWPNNKKKVTAHTVRQADRQTGGERERKIERDSDCVAMAHLWHRLLLTYAIKLSRNYTEICATISQLAPNPSDDPAEMFAFVLLHY